MKDLTPQQIVRELDRYIVGQVEAKRVVAVALRNRFRRLSLPADVQAEITPKNILMIGPTGVGKTEIARRLAKLADAPFVKVEATKFTQVGYVGRDVESILRDLMDVAIGMAHDERANQVREKAAARAELRILDLLTDKMLADETPPSATREKAAAKSSRKTGGASSLAVPVAASSATVGKPAAPVPARRKRQQTQKLVAEQLARQELEEQMIEIELDPEEGFSSVFEFVAGMSSEDLGDGFQEFLNTMPSGRRRSKLVSVKEARRLLTQEEANRLIDFDAVIEQATQRVEQAGVVFLDEIDKVVGSKVDMGPDVSGEGVQRDLLPIVEGSTVMTRFGPIKTDHILWIAAGAFHHAKPSDLIPELQGRLPLRVELASLAEADYHRILTQPENALTRQYEALLGVEQVALTFTEDGLTEIARCAFQMNERVENIGARRLQTIMEKVLEEVSFNAPEMAGQTVTVDAAFVRGRLESLMKDEDLSRYIL
ncbi:MAG: ATP-dependent hsl protease ATP-binding subunit HslU [Ktedonobacterales bacterium]|jgi:ATP-dependent HslUV protease ATP-binding subunit HslU|nr:MAG: ATP-dependent hsl protease ATP-binding subunit HslU [Ktedonobacterales bacterium]